MRVATHDALAEITLDKDSAQEPPRPSFPAVAAVPVQLRSARVVQQKAAPLAPMSSPPSSSSSSAAAAAAAVAAANAAAAEAAEMNGPLGIPIRFRPNVGQQKASAQRMPSSKVKVFYNRIRLPRDVP